LDTGYALYRVIVDFCRYWRHLELTAFEDLEESAQEELYFFFTEKLLHIYDLHLDLYWLIGDFDGQPLFSSGREPAPFWRKRLNRRENQLKRFDNVY